MDTAISTALPASWFRDPGIEPALSTSAGRGVFTTRVFRRGERCFEDQPYTFAVVDECADRVCYACSAAIAAAAASSCPGCHRVSYCSTRCREQDRAAHHLECVALSTLLQDTRELSASIATFEIRLLLRTLARRELERGANDSPATHRFQLDGLRHADYEQLLTHRDRVDGDTLEAWRDIATRLRRLLRWAPSIECIVRTALAARINRFDLHSLEPNSLESGREAVGVYLAASLLNHACEPSVEMYRVDGRGCRPTIGFRALIDLAAGDELTLRYGVDPRFETRAQLATTFYFDCQCSSCCPQQELAADRRAGPASARWLEL